MTKVRFYLNKQGKYLGFQTQGHAGYADAGEDIVCAGISALVLNTINSIEAFSEDRMVVEEDEKAGMIKFKVYHTSDETQLLIKSLHLGLSKMQENYDRFIRVSIKEV